MKELREKITSHLIEANKTYFQHMRGAAKTCRQCFLAGTAAMIHGVLPFVFETTASDTIRKIYQRQNPTKKDEVP